MYIVVCFILRKWVVGLVCISRNNTTHLSDLALSRFLAVCMQ